VAKVEALQKQVDDAAADKQSMLDKVATLEGRVTDLEAANKRLSLAATGTDTTVAKVTGQVEANQKALATLVDELDDTVSDIGVLAKSSQDAATCLGDVSSRAGGNASDTCPKPKSGASTKCTELKDIEGGKVHGQGSGVGSARYYTCDEGFAMQGKAHTFCQASLEWSSTPSCIPTVTCLLSIDNDLGDILADGKVLRRSQVVIVPQERQIQTPLYAGTECCDDADCSDSNNYYKGMLSYQTCSHMCLADKNCKFFELGADGTTRCSAQNGNRCKCYLVPTGCSKTKPHTGYNVFRRPSQFTRDRVLTKFQFLATVQVLGIKGSDAERGCGGGGLWFRCTSTVRSPWDGVSSSSARLKALGSTNKAKITQNSWAVANSYAKNWPAVHAKPWSKCMTADPAYWKDVTIGPDGSVPDREACVGSQWQSSNAQQVCADEDDAQNDKPKGTPGNLVPMYWWFRYEHA